MATEKGVREREKGYGNGYYKEVICLFYLKVAAGRYSKKISLRSLFHNISPLAFGYGPESFQPACNRNLELMVRR